jgi:hypothetical protein
VNQLLVNPQYKKRREELKISHLPYHPIGDRLLIKRIALDTYSKSDSDVKIYKPEKYRGTETRGLLCSAGPQALDGLLTHGTLLGDIVWVAKYVDWEEGGWIFARVEELCGSEDLLARMGGNTKRGGIFNNEELTAEDVGGEVDIDLDEEGNYIFKFLEKGK